MIIALNRSSVFSAACAAILLAGAPAIGAAQSSADPAGFRVGDRIALTIEGPLQVTDTVVVREGLVLQLRTLGDVSLKGVSRSNVQTYLTQEVRKYVKDATVYATPLIRVGVLGEVARPGFYSMPMDVLLSDAVMRAGGPAPGGDLTRATVRRGSADLLEGKQVVEAMSAGKTLSDMQLADGDQIIVGQRSQGGLDTMLRVTGVVAALAAVVLTVSRH
jgi:polysaccharide export outer membrane protein